ncbi:DUF4245 domain-containing protein [Prescottella defluvii]|uniref:hypothetical protein n=1 Tax=Prescottella defluvii TaxID=1323361 RepID=UPI001E2D178B|nr:hypothetical protein [Prescottella defluvii]
MTERLAPARSADSAVDCFEPDDRWVPVDRRWLGLDRRTILPTLVVLAFVLVMSVILPAIDGATPYDDTVAAGDVMEIEGGVTFVPAVDWGITSGVRAGDAPTSGSYPPSATVVDGDVSFSVRSAPFSGDATGLLDQIKQTSEALNGDNGFRVTGTPVDITTADGSRGVLARYSGTASEGVIAAFVFDGIGVEAVATGPAEIADDSSSDIGAMIASISHSMGEGA